MLTARSERTRPVAAVVIMLALVAAVGGWWWSNRETRPRLGDYGQVTAEVTLPCLTMRIYVDDLWLKEAQMLPRSVRRSEVSGTLELTARRDGDEVEGIFTADDGTEVEVWGGPSDSTFFDLSCAIPHEETG